MTPTSQQKNGEIELARFLFALLILSCHAQFFPGCPAIFKHGRVGVEFFFLLSGFLMAASIYRKGNPSYLSWGELNRETAHFLWRKLSSFYPELVIACLICVFFSGCVYYTKPLAVAAMCMRTFVANILLLGTTNFSVKSGLNAPSWYLASMIWSMAILYPLYRRFGLNSILPALSLVVLGRFFIDDKQSDTEFALLLGGANIRGFCELACGAALFPLSMRLSQIDFRPWLRTFLLVVKIACYGIVLKQAVGEISPHFGGSGLVLFALMVIVVLSFSKVCSDSELYQHRCIFWLGRFSLPLFLSHFFYAFSLQSLLHEQSSAVFKFLLYNACSFATALLVMYLAGLVRRFFREHPNFFLNPSAGR